MIFRAAEGWRVGHEGNLNPRQLRDTGAGSLVQGHFALGLISQSANVLFSVSRQMAR